MKPIPGKAGKKAAFTIIELLTVMSIIVILVGLLVPSLNMVRRYARRVKQNAQFHAIDVSLELFYNEWDGYPPSDAEDGVGNAYCGAMKLAEAMLGQDLKGFDPESRFKRDATFPPARPDAIYNLPPAANDDLSDRRKYLPVEHTNFYRLNQIYRDTKRFSAPPALDPNSFRVLYDEYTQGGTMAGRRVGMPVLYYRANPSNTGHGVDDVDANIYDYRDNHELLGLGIPSDLTGLQKHPMFVEPPILFYEMTRNKNITIETPYRSDSYILMSAGWDGLYGTKDDIFNFGM